MKTRSLVMVWLFLVILSISGLVVSGADQDVQAVNQAIKNLGASWTAGETSISKLTPEKQAKRCGAILEEISDSERMAVPISKGVLPEHFDWRNVDGNDWTTSIKDQDGCGSCWDFSAVGVFEMLLDYASGDPADSPGEDLSEQYVLSCCSNCGSCNGGSPSSAFDFLQSTGTVSEACLPYTSDDSISCGSACSDAPQKIGDWTYIYNDVESIKRAIYEFGPVSAAFAVYADFSYYVNGVYEHVWGALRGYHAIDIVGWDDAGQAWICKNSWGTNWGETIDGDPYTPGAGDGGWFRIKWGNCSINNYVIMATLTSWPSGIVNVTVLDVLGHPVENTKVYVNRDWYGNTSHSGTVSFDLIEGMSYEVTAFSPTDHFVMYNKVVAPGNVVLDCRDASYVTATAKKLDGSPLDVGLYFQIGNKLWCPEHTYGGTGWFYITPGTYDLQAWSWWDSTDTEKYNLSFQDVDLTSSTSISIDAGAMPTGRFTLQTLVDFSALELVPFAEGFSQAHGWRLEEGDSLICTVGDYRTYMSLVQEEGDSVTWNYYRPSMQQALVEGQVISLEAGGELSLSATPDHETYEPGIEARISTQMTDGFGNPITWVDRYDDIPPPAVLIYQLGTDGELEAFQSDGSLVSRGWDYFNPWMVVTSPSAVKLIDHETCLVCSDRIYLDNDAELGTYNVRVTQETHLGEIEGTSTFEVALPGPDPYEPNDTCDTAHDLGDVTNGFTSNTAHFVDANQDWFTFNLTSSGLLVVDTQLLGDYSDTVVYLYNVCGGELLAYNDDYGSRASHIEYRAAPGKYYLLVDQNAQNYGANTNYKFTINLLPAPSIAVHGNDPITINIPAGNAQDFSDLIKVANVGQAGSTLNYRVLQQEIPITSSSAVGAPLVKGNLRNLFPASYPASRSSKGNPPTGDWTLLFIDNDEPPTGGVDLKGLYAQIDDGILYFKGTTYEPWEDPSNLGVGIFLDMDQDPSTGCNTETGKMNMNDIGAEYGLNPICGYLYEFQGGNWQQVKPLDYVSMPNNANEFVVGVALSALLPKAVTGGIDVIFLLQDFATSHLDFAPDAGEGHVTYPSAVNWLTETPDNGAMAQGNEGNITLSVDATGLTAGETQHVRLFFLSNDGSVVPTRDVEVVVEPSPCQESSSNLQASGWHMVTLPGDLCGTEPDLLTALSDDLDPCQIFHYDLGVGSYVMAPPAENIQYHAGMGFWVRTYEDSVTIDAEVQVATEAVEVPLGNGWNQIGNPFAFGVAANALKVRCEDTELSLTDAQAHGWASAYLFGYDTASGGYVMLDPTTGCLQPWNGYWMRSYQDGCVLIISPTECSSSSPAGQPLSAKELQARGLELPPSPPNDLINLDVKEVLAGLTVRNVPNPIRSRHTTTFKVEGKGAELVQAIRVEIYNQAGQSVFTQDINAKELEWHTVNDAGELLANAVYLYQVWVKIADTWYPTGVHKLAVIR